MDRTATAIWNGSGKEGSGNVTTQSSVLSKNQYSYKSRFEQGTGTNPEELIAAAHAGCFSMKLSFVLGSAGFIPDSIETTSTVTLNNGVIESSRLVVKAKVPDISQERFQQCVEEAKNTCPVSKALSAINITAEAQLL
ncbi:MAG TPA: OsmC family protein [Chitinophagaceae bacterium]|nr:OsmC family protein [Chitinophagaceae bacterium]